MDSAPHSQARRRTAFDEAGHAVVAWALGRSVTGLRLLSDQDGEANVEEVGSLPLVEQSANAMGDGMARRGAVLSNSTPPTCRVITPSRSASRDPRSLTTATVLFATPSTVRAVI